MAVVTDNVLLRGKQARLSAPPGTPPATTESATVVINWNADLLDGFHADAFGQLSNANTWTQAQTFSQAPLPSTHLGPALGSAVRRWNNAYIGGLDAAGNALIGGTLGVTGLISGTIGTAAQPNITSLGTLTSLTVAQVSNNSSVRVGSLEVQTFAVNNVWLADNAYYDGTAFRRRSSGYAAQLYFQGAGGFALRQAASGAAGDAITWRSDLAVSAAGVVGIGGAALIGALAGDIVTPSGRGYVCNTPDGTKRYRLSVDNAGALTITLL